MSELEKEKTFADGFDAGQNEAISFVGQEAFDAIRVWRECPKDRRPSPEALGKRIAEIAAAELLK
jgi:hypothetical protein